MKKILLSALLLTSTSTTVLAAGYTNLVVPTRIDVERGEGFAIFGNFGNPGGCTNSNVIFVRSSSPHYKEMYAAALGAFMGKYRIQVYVTACQTITWYTAAPDTMNVADTNSVFNIAD